jgi:selenide,water dikinase
MEMADASKVSLFIENSKLPLLSGANGYAQKGIFPGGAFDNLKHYGGKVRFDPALGEPAQMLLFDPQTSGGLLLGVPQEKLAAFMKRAEELSQPVWEIGEVRKGKGIEVHS